MWNSLTFQKKIPLPQIKALKTDQKFYLTECCVFFVSYLMFLLLINILSPVYVYSYCPETINVNEQGFES